MSITTFPPRYVHEEYNENLYEWTERGVENPHEFDWSHVFYTCKFCPSRANEPEDVVHNPMCPVAREVS